MTPVYDQVRSFLTDTVHYAVRDGVQIEPRTETLKVVVDGVNNIIRPACVETTDKLY